VESFIFQLTVCHFNHWVARLTAKISPAGRDDTEETPNLVRMHSPWANETRSLFYSVIQCMSNLVDLTDFISLTLLSLSSSGNLTGTQTSYAFPHKKKQLLQDHPLKSLNESYA